jgi:hypothetical protein
LDEIMEKVLWVVNYNKLDEFVKRAVAVGATAVAIRTDNDISKALPVFKGKNIKVYGWRWPSAMVDPAMKEATKVVGLLAEGMDGYYVDPEGEPGKPYDWDQNGLEKLAEDFCRKITSAAPGKPFGTTSHYRGNKLFKRLPWKSFFKFSTVLLPQAYWRVDGGVVGHGIPKDNYDQSIEFWTATGGDKAKIVPMAGELAHTTAGEIDEYVSAAKNQGIRELHFYTHLPNVKDGVWKAIARA